MKTGVGTEQKMAEKNSNPDRTSISEYKSEDRTSISKCKSKGPIQPRQAVLESQAYDAPLEGRVNSIRFDFNESTSPVPGCFPEGMPGELVSMYPEYGALLAKLAARFDLQPENFTLTNGSDEAISLISNTFIEHGKDLALISTPCFFMIKQCLRLAGAKLQEVRVDSNLQFDLDEIEAALKCSPKLAMFATPDNPTGSIIPTETIEQWCRDYPDVLLVIDEAYGEYAGTSVIPLISKYDNLLVLKTFSKAWGMAGFRLGMVVGNARLIEFLRRVKLPYSVNSAAVFTALRLLDCEPDVVARVAETVKLRSRLASFLTARGYAVRETNANWCLLGTGFLAKEFSEFTASKNLLVRNRSTSEFSRFGCSEQSETANCNGVNSGCSTTSRDEPLSIKRSETPVLSGSEPPLIDQPHFEPMWGQIRVSAGNADEVAQFETIVDQFRNSYALIFDLDGTLVDTSKSFDKTVEYLVEKFSGMKLDLAALAALRREGGFNDDWVASQELLKRRGFNVALQEVAREGERYYLSIAKDSEELLLPISLLERLRKRHPLFIVTGRTRAEYAPVWGDRLDPLFERVYCVDDVPGCRAKPNPDYLLQVLKDTGIMRGAYVGNAVDDMQAARAARLTAIGVAAAAASTLPQLVTSETLATPEMSNISETSETSDTPATSDTSDTSDNSGTPATSATSATLVTPATSEQVCQRTALQRAGAHALIADCTELETLLMVAPEK